MDLGSFSGKITGEPTGLNLKLCGISVPLGIKKITNTNLSRFESVKIYSIEKCLKMKHKLVRS